MRSPMAKGFASIATPMLVQHGEGVAALCPMASTT